MDSQLTAPFGSRSLTCAQIQAARLAAGRDPAVRIDKWKLFAAIRQARAGLGLGDRSLAVLSALLSFFPDAELGGDNLIVFPSNAVLMQRANGMAPATLRRHLAALTESGLIVRRDSPNGKRYARQDSTGRIATAFGFDLSPLVVRAEALFSAAEAARAAERRLHRLREEISLLRREIAKLLAFAAATAPADDSHAVLTARLEALSAPPQRLRSLPQAEALARDLRAVHNDVDKSLRTIVYSTDMSASALQTERHIQDSESQFLSESESRQTADEPDNCEQDTHNTADTRPALRRSAPAIELVIRACPDTDLLSAAPLRSHEDLIRTAQQLCPLLDISPSAWQNARATMGAAEAAITVAGILQRASEIRSPGGYLRALTRRAAAGRYSTAPMLNALLSRQQAAGAARTMRR